VDQPVDFVASLALAMMVISLIAVELRALRFAAWAYLGQALLLVTILLVFAFATHSEWLLVWAVVALVTKAGLIPWLLFKYIAKMEVTREAEPYVDFAPSLLFASVLMVGLYRLTHAHTELLGPGTTAALEPFRTNLAVAVTLFALGLYAIISRRDAIKVIIGLCLLENGVHLSLVSLAPAMPEMPIIGLVTEVFITVWMLLDLVLGVERTFGTTDTAVLQKLKE